MRIPRWMAQSRVELIDLLGRQRVLHVLGPVVPLAGGYPRPVCEVSLPQPMGSNQANGRLSALAGEGRPVVVHTDQAHCGKTREQNGRPGDRDLQAACQAFKRAGRTGPLALVDMFERVFQAHPLAKPKEFQEPRNQSVPRPQEDGQAGNDDGEDEQRFRGIRIRHLRFDNLIFDDSKYIVGRRTSEVKLACSRVNPCYLRARSRTT